METTKKFKSIDRIHDSIAYIGYSLRNSIIKNRDLIYEIILSAVKELNIIKRLAQKANLFLIEIASEDNSVHLLHPSTHGNARNCGGQKYFYQLLTIIRNEKMTKKGEMLPIFEKYLARLKPFFLNQIGKFLNFKLILFRLLLQKKFKTNFKIIPRQQSSFSCQRNGY